MKDYFNDEKLYFNDEKVYVKLGPREAGRMNAALEQLEKAKNALECALKLYQKIDLPDKEEKK